LSDPIRVVAAVIRRNGRILVARRPAGSHLAGLWEFPGGKVQEGETDVLAVQRELHEELVLTAEVENFIGKSRAVYPGKTVEIYFYQCRLSDPLAEPELREAADIRWASPVELMTLNMPEADRDFVEHFL